MAKDDPAAMTPVAAVARHLEWLEFALAAARDEETRRRERLGRRRPTRTARSGRSGSPRWRPRSASSAALVTGSEGSASAPRRCGPRSARTSSTEPPPKSSAKRDSRAAVHERAKSHGERPATRRRPQRRSAPAATAAEARGRRGPPSRKSSTPQASDAEAEGAPRRSRTATTEASARQQDGRDQSAARAGRRRGRRPPSDLNRLAEWRRARDESAPPSISGSTSVHLLVADVVDHRIEPLVDESVFLGLGRGRRGAGPSRRRRVARALVDVLARYATVGPGRLARRRHVRRHRAAAPAGGRVAHRRTRSTRATGVPLHVLSHEEEASSCSIGVTEGRPVEHDLARRRRRRREHRVRLRRARAARDRRGAAARGDAADAAVRRRRPADARASWRPFARRPPTRSPRPRRSDPAEIVLVGGTASNLLKVVPDGLASAAIDVGRPGRRRSGSLPSEPSDAIAARSRPAARPGADPRRGRRDRRGDHAPLRRHGGPGRRRRHPRGDGPGRRPCRSGAGATSSSGSPTAGCD